MKARALKEGIPIREKPERVSRTHSETSQA